MEIMEGENVTKVEALLEIIHQARDNPKLVEAIEALLVGEESVRDSAGSEPEPGKKGAAPKQQEAEPSRKRSPDGSQSTQARSSRCVMAVGLWQRSPMTLDAARRRSGTTWRRWA